MGFVNKLPSITTTLLAIGVPLFAEPPLLDVSPCCKEYIVNPPYIDCPCGFSASVGFLYYKPYQDQNAWATFVQPLDGNSENLADRFTTFKGSSTSKEVDYEWDSGFTVGLGYIFPCDYWKIEANFDHYETDIENRVSSNKGIFNPAFMVGTITPSVFPIFDNNTLMAEGVARWRLRFNQLDIDLRRSFYTGCSLILTPFVGLRGIWIYQDYDISIENNYFITDGSNTFTFASESTMQTSFKSFGLKGGLSSFYAFFCGLGIYGDFAASLVYGCSRSIHNYVERIIEDDDSIDSGFNQASDEWNNLRAVLDLSIGLEWKTRFNEERSDIYVRIGWDHHIYFNQNLQVLITPPPQPLSGLKDQD